MFGTISMVGWLLPLVVAISWRGASNKKWLISLCYFLLVVNLATIYWMLSPIGVAEDNEFAGVAQRSCFLALYISFTVIGVVIYRENKNA